MVSTPSSSWDLPSYAANAAQVMATLPSPPSRQSKRSFDSRTMQYLDVEADDVGSEDSSKEENDSPGIYG